VGQGALSRQPEETGSFEKQQEEAGFSEAVKWQIEI
jgi:hypothetical protein